VARFILRFTGLGEVPGEDLARIRELHRAYYRQVRAIASASSPTDVVVLLNLQLVGLGPASSS